MALPDRLNENPSGRFASTPYAGPLYTPSEARAELSRRQREQRAREDAQRQAANAETKISADEFGIKTMEAGGSTVPKVITDPGSGAQTLEYEPTEITDTQGRKRKIGKSGQIESIPQGVSQYLPGDGKTEGMSDPSILYRVERAPEEISQEGYEAGMRRPRKVEAIGKIDLLTDATNPEVQIAARQNMLKRNQAIFGDAKSMLKNREDTARNEAQEIENRKRELEMQFSQAPVVPNQSDKEGDSGLLQVEQRQKQISELESKKLEASKRMVDFGRQRLALEALEKDTAHIEALNKAVSNARARGEDPNKDPIVTAIKDSYANLKMQAPEIQDPLYAGSLVNPVRGLMIDPGEGSPEAAAMQERQGFSETAKQNELKTLEDIKAQISERKRKAEPILQYAEDRTVEFNVKRATRDRLADRYNALLASQAQASPEDANIIDGQLTGLERLISSMDEELKVRQENAEKSAAGAEAEKQFANENAAMIEQAGRQKIAEGYKKANELISAQKKREEIATPPAVDQRPVLIDKEINSIPEEQLPQKQAELVQQGLLPQAAEKQSLPRNLINQLVKGTMVANQRMMYAGFRAASNWLKSDPRLPNGIMDMVLNPADTGWFEEAAEAAKRNAEWWNKTFQTDEEFNQSYVGQVAKGVSELPAQFAPYIATGGVGGVALGSVYNFAYLMDEAYQRIDSSPKSAEMNDVEKANLAAKYALPAAVLDTVSDKFTLGVGKKLLGRPLREGASVLRGLARKGYEVLKSGAVEGTTEVLQDAWLDKLAQVYELEPETAIFTKDKLKTFAVAGTVGLIAPVAISGGKTMVVTADAALDNRQKAKRNQQSADITSDIPRGSWAQWMEDQEKNYSPAVSEGQQLLGITARTSPLGAFTQLRGKISNIIVEKGQDLDTQIGILEASTARPADRPITQKLADAFRAPQRRDELDTLNELYMRRAALASAAQNELKAREAVVREIEALPNASADGSYNPRGSALAVAKFYVESPSLTEAELKLKMGKDPLFTKDMNGNTVPNQRFIDEVLPQLASIQPFIERSKSTAAELGTQLTPEQTRVPETAPIVATPEEQMRRVTGDRLQGKNPSERITSFAKRIYDLNQKIVPTLGKKYQIKLETSGTEGAGYQTIADPDGVRIIISIPDFKRLEANPEENNRALNEEIFHAADKLSAYVEADQKGIDREAYWKDRRTKLYSDLVEASKTDSDILGALAASADIYFRGKQDIMRGELRDNLTGEGIVAAAEELGVEQWRLMSEFMRQYKTRRRLTEAKVEAIAGSRSQSLMTQIAEYLKGIYRMLNNFTKGLGRNPELKAQFEAEMKKIDDILNMPEGGPSAQTQETTLAGQPQTQPKSAQKSSQTKFAPDPTLGNRPDAVLALQALGYKRKEAEKMVSATDPALSSDEIVRSALGQTKKPGVVVRQGEQRQESAPQAQAPQTQIQPEGLPPGSYSRWYPNPQMQLPEDRLYNPPPERPAIESAAAIEAELGQREKIVKSPQGAEALRRQLAEQQKRGERNARRRARTAELRTQAEAQRLDASFNRQLRNAFVDLYDGPVREKLAAGTAFSALEPAEREEIITTLRDGAQSEGWLTQSRADLAQLAAETRSANDRQAFLDEAKRIEEFQNAAKEFVATLPKQKQAKAPAIVAPQPKVVETAPVEYRVFTQNYPNTIVVGGARIVDLGELQDMEGTEIQPRARKQRAGYDQEVENIAMNLNPEQLMPGTATGDGAPVILRASSNPYRTTTAKQFDIISGHGRTKALRRAYEAYPEKANTYKEMLLQKFPQFRQQILASRMPVVATEMNLGESLKTSNTQAKAKATPKQFLRRLAVQANPNLAKEELAVADAREVLDDPKLAFLKGGSRLITAEGRPVPGNEDALKLWFNAFGRPQNLLDDKGNYTSEFEQRVRMALLASSLGENGVYADADLSILGMVVEAERNQITELVDALMHSAPAIKSLRTEAAGLFPEQADAFDPMVPVASGLRAFLQERRDAKAAGRKTPEWNDIVDNIKSQLQGMEGAELNPASIAIFGPIAEFKDSAPKMRAYLSGIAGSLKTALTEYRETGGTDMFGNPIPLAENMEQTIVDIANRSAAIVRDAGLRARTSNFGKDFEKGENESGIDWLRRVYREYEEMNVDDLYITEREVAEQTRLMLETEDMPGNTFDLETALQAYETAEMEDRMYYGMRSGEDVIQLDLFMKVLDRYLANPDGLQARTSLPSDPDYLSRRPPEPTGEEIQTDLFDGVQVPKTRSSEFTPEMRDAYLHYFPTGETSAAVRSLAKEFVNPDSISKGFTFEAFVDFVDDILIEVIPQAFRAAKTPMAYIDRAVKNNLRTRLTELQERFTSLDAPTDSPDATPNEQGIIIPPEEIGGVEAPSTESPEFLDKELSKDLYAVLDRLPKQIRDTFEARTLEGKAFKDIARERGLRQGGWQVIEKEYQAAQKLLGEYLTTLSPDGVRRFKEGVRRKAESNEFGLQARTSPLGLDGTHSKTGKNLDANVEKVVSALGEDGGVFTLSNSFQSITYSVRPSSLGWTAIPLRHANQDIANQYKEYGFTPKVTSNQSLENLVSSLPMIGALLRSIKTLNRNSQRRAFKLGDTFANFYSAAAEAIREKMPAQATRDQVEGILRSTPGVKMDELRWIGMDDILNGMEKDGKINKDALIDAIIEEVSSMFYAADANVDEYASWSSRGVLTRTAEITPLRRRGEQKAMSGTGLYANETLAFLKNTTLETPEKDRMVHDAFRGDAGMRYIAHNRTDVLTSNSDKTEGLVIDELQQDAKADTPFGIVPLQKKFEIEGRRQGSPYLMMFKIALAKAVETGKSWIGITTGEAQSERYSKGKYVDELRVLKYANPVQLYEDRSLAEGAMQFRTGDASKDVQVGKTMYAVTGLKNGKPAIVQSPGAKDKGVIFRLNAQELEELIGKELTAQIVGSAKAPVQVASEGDVVNELSSEFSAGPDATVFKQPGLTLGSAGLLRLYDRTIPQEVNKYVSKWGGKLRLDSVGLGVDKQFVGSRPDAKQTRRIFMELGAILSGYQSLAEAVDAIKAEINNGQIMPSLIAEPEKWITGWGMDYSADRFKPVKFTGLTRFLEIVEKAYGNRSFPYSYRKETIQNAIAELENAPAQPSGQAMPDPRAWKNVREAVDLVTFLNLRPRFNERTKEWQLVDEAGRPNDDASWANGMAASYLVSALDTMQLLREVLSLQDQVADAESVLGEMSAQGELSERPQEHFENAQWQVKHFSKQIDNTLAQLDTTGAFLLGGVIEQAKPTDGVPIYRLDITPQMAQDVKAGQALFARLSGATQAETRQIGELFKEKEEEESIHRLFVPPAKDEVVRAEERATKLISPKEADKVIQGWMDHAYKQGKASINGKNANADKIVLSLFDYTGEWSKPWAEAGYQVYQFDTQLDEESGDVNNFSVDFFNNWFNQFDGQDVHAILAACPCTDFAVSGARHFAAKDADGRTLRSVQLVNQTLATIEYFKPAVWALENPVGRIEQLTGLPPWRLSFNPSNFGDPYTKKTLIWGRFNAELPLAPVEATEGSKMWRKYGGKSQATKNARSVTPEGFAYAFFMANNYEDNRAMSLAGKYDRLNPRVFQMAEEYGITDDQIKEAIDDAYYMDLDDKKAEQALLKLMQGKSKVRKPIERLEPAKTGWQSQSERTGLDPMTREEMIEFVEPILERIRSEVEVGKKGKEAIASLIQRLPKKAKAIFEKYIKVVGAERGFPIDDGTEVVMRLVSSVQQARRGEPEQKNPGKFIAEYPRELFNLEETSSRSATTPEPDVVLPQEGENSPGMEQMSLFARLSSTINEIEAGLVSTDSNRRIEAVRRMSRTAGLSGGYGRIETANDRLERFMQTALVPEALEIEFGFRTPEGQEPLGDIEKMRRRKADDVQNVMDLRRVMLRRNPALLREILRPAAITPGTPQYRKNKSIERDMMRASGSLLARTTLDLSRPESFEEVSRYLASEFPIDNVPALVAGIRNGAELGRGDLANPGLSQEVRDLVDAVDEARKETLTQRPDKVVDAAAQEMAENPDFATRMLRKAKSGETATDAEVSAIRILLGRVSKTALANPGSEEGRRAAILVHTYRKLATEWGRAGRQMQDSILSPAQRHLEFLLTTILTPRGKLIQRKRLKKALDSAMTQSDKDARISELVTEIERLRSQPEMQISEPDPAAMARLAQQIQRLEQQNLAGQEANTELLAQTESLKNDLAEARARARIARGYRQKMTAMQSQIALLEAKLKETQAAATYEDILASDGKEKMAQVNQALAKLGTSFEQLLAESEMVQLRTSKVAKQIYDSVKMTDEERKSAQLASLGYDPSKLKIRPERLSEIMKQLRAEADRRFKRFAEGRPTQAELDEFLRRMREDEGGSLMARMDDSNERLTPEQAMEQIYKALGHTIEYKGGKFQVKDRQGRTNLFDLKKPEHAYILASGIMKADPSFESMALELYTSLILSGIGTQVVNFINVPTSPIFTSLFRGLEAFKIYATQKAARRTGDDLLDATTPAYQTLKEAAQGAFNEIFYIWKGAMAGFIPALSYATLAWETEAGFFMAERTGYGGPEDAIQKFAQPQATRVRQRIPGKAGRIARIPLRALTAADEFNKAWRAYMNAGATAYRMGKEIGLTGPALGEFIAKEVNNPQTASWRLSGQRAERETFTRDLPNVTSRLKPKGLGDVFGILPGLLQSLNMFMAGRREAAYEEGGAIGVAERAAWAFASTFNMFLKTTYNITREGLSYAPLPVTAPNLIYRYSKARSRGDATKGMSAEDYEMFVMRLAQTMPSTLLLAMLYGAFEGDDDDDKKFLLITGSADKKDGSGWKTRFGNTPYSVRLGGTTIEYGRVEPIATSLGASADLARSAKEVQNGALVANAVARFAQDLVFSPLDKTFGKSRKDLTKMFSFKQDTWQGWSVLRDRLMPFTITGAPIVRKFLTAPDDIVRDAETQPFSRRAMMDMVMPRPEPWRAMGMLGPEEDILPPKLDVDGTVRKKTGGTTTRALIPGQGIYQELPKTPLQRFISSYNTRFPDSPWNPQVPDRTIIHPVTGKKIYLTTQQYAIMRNLAAGALQQRLSNAIGANDLQNPTREKKQELSNIIADANSQARKIVAAQIFKGRIEKVMAGEGAGPR